jgi:stage III sporulation protein AD
LSDTVKICGIAIICAIICILVKNYQSGFIVPTRIAGMIILYSAVILLLSPLVKYLLGIMDGTISAEHIELIVKSMSIAYITQATSEICKECGENSLATGVDTIGKMEILILAIPLIENLIGLAGELVSW